VRALTQIIEITRVSGTAIPDITTSATPPLTGSGANASNAIPTAPMQADSWYEWRACSPSSRLSTSRSATAPTTSATKPSPVNHTIGSSRGSPSPTSCFGASRPAASAAPLIRNVARKIRRISGLRRTNESPRRKVVHDADHRACRVGTNRSSVNRNAR